MNNHIITNMKKILTLYKPISATPLELIEKYKEKNPEYKYQKMTYAGRLDPMAEGIMIILTGDECKNKQEYLNLDKTYLIDILWGIETDSYDTLGMVENINSNNPNPKEIITKLTTFTKSFEQQYPPYSSKSVNGKPLWQWQKEGRISEIGIPTKNVTIHSIKHIKDYTKSKKDILSKIIANISNLKGNFRQNEIIKSWRENTDKITDFHISQIEVNCSSGTYMRSLAHNLGKQLGTAGLALNINRTNVGQYTNSSNT